jgi:hypothetical protein
VRRFHTAGASWRGASGVVRMAQVAIKPGVGHGNVGVHAGPGVPVGAARKPIAVPAMWQQADGGDV